MTKYSVPSFGGHIDFSDDVTIYPVLVMARTVQEWLGTSWPEVPAGHSVDHMVLSG